MLNLVQVQERLKDVPMQALMQYANGSNPQIPPFLALGELNRRKKMQESAAAEQAQATEGAPTVKQQIEQAAGLMALQGNRQRQAAQQQQGIQANAPMPAPNTTTSEPAQLAGGGYIDDIVVPRDFQAGGGVNGLDALRKMMLIKKLQERRRQPVNNMQRSDFAGGGIVAFQAGGRSIADPIGAAPYESEEEKRRREEEEIASGRREGYSPEVQRRIIERSRAADRARMQESGEQERLLERGREIAREATAGREAGIGSLMKPTSAQAPRPVPIPRTPEGPLVSDTYPDETQRGTRRDLARDPSKTREGVVGRPGIVDLLPPSLSEGADSGIARTPKTTEDIEFLRKMYKTPDEDYLKKLKEAGLAERPQSRKTIEELMRQREEIKGEDTLANRLLSLTPGRRFGSGQTGKGLMAFEKEQSTKLRTIGMELAKAEDLEAQADYQFKRGNFDKANDLKRESDKLKVDAAKTAGSLGVSLEQVAAQRESTAATRGATVEMAKSRQASQFDQLRLRELQQETSPIIARIAAIRGITTDVGSKPNPTQQAELDRLTAELEAIKRAINKKYDQKVAAIDSGDFKVIGVKPGQ